VPGDLAAIEQRLFDIRRVVSSSENPQCGLKCASVSPGAESFLSRFAAPLLERPLKPLLFNQLSAEISWQILRSATSGATGQSVLLFEQYQLWETERVKICQRKEH
jgi:hypothetical protein